MDSIALKLTISRGSSALEDEDLIISLVDELRESMRTAEVSRKTDQRQPPNSKVGGNFSLYELLIVLGASGGALVTLISALQAWVLRQHGHSISIEIGGDKLEIRGPSSLDQKKLVDAWISKHQQ